MAGNAENQYAPASNEPNPGGAWGAAPPIMHSWCLQSDEPASGSAQAESRDRNSRLANDADDDCGFDLNLGLSLGGGKSSKPKGREREKEKEKEKEKGVLLDRDTFRDKDSFRGGSGERREGGVSKDGNGEEAYHGGVMFKPFKTEQGEAMNPNPNRVQHSFWQDLDRGGSEAKEKTAVSSFPPRQAQAPAPNQQAVEASRWAGENSVAEDSKMFAQHMWQALQGKAAQPEHQRVPLSAQDEASLINELQGLPPQAVATAAAWARVVAQGGFPMQILEAIKEGVDPAMSRGAALQRSMSMKSHSSGPQSEVIPTPSPPRSQQTPGSNADLERSDSDVSKNMQVDDQQRQVAMMAQQDALEQERKRELQTQKRQEARRKRKALLEGQKSKKSSKKEEERPGPGGPGGSQGSKSGLETPPNALRRASSLQLMGKDNSVSMASSPPDSQDAGGASSISAFRRPGSSSWLHHWDANNPNNPAPAPAKAKSEKDARASDLDSGEQVVEIRRALERARDRGAKDRGENSGGHVESISEARKLSSPDVVQLQRMDLDSNAAARQAPSRQDGSNLGLPPGMVNGPIDPAWIQKIMEMQMSSYQLSQMKESSGGKMMPNFPHLHRRADGGAERAAPMAEPEKAAKKGRASSQTSSGGTGTGTGTESSQDEKSGNGARVAPGDADALSSPAGSAAAGGEPRPNPPNALMPSVSNAMAMANMAFPQGGAFPMMPGAFPFPLPVPPGGGPGGVPFSVPFPFPYLMQFAPSSASGGDANPEQRPLATMPSPFQIALPGGFNPPFPVQSPEGSAAWPSAVVRPHATPPQSPPRSAAAKASSQSALPRDDDKLGPRGAKGKEHARSQTTSPSRDGPAQSLGKANSMGSGAFNRLRSTAAPANSPLAPQFGLSRSKSDAHALPREGSVGSAFAALGESQPQPQPQPQHPFPPSNGQAHSADSGPKGNAPAVPRPEPAHSRAATPSGEEAGPSPPAHPEVSAAQSTSAGEELPRRSHCTGVWRQGSTPSFEGISGQEAASLRPGLAPGLQFGGTGAPPELPWVTCNGTISGVLYRVEKGQVRIVCACHGKHMTPAEFVQHAGCGEIPNPEKAIVVSPFTVLSQQAASAQA